MISKCISWFAVAAVISAFFAISTPALAGYELVCAGSAAQSSHTTIKVDCSNRQAVVEILGKAWNTLRQQGIGGSTENLCWDPYQRVRELHPAISIDGIAETFFMQCNMALQYAR